MDSTRIKVSKQTARDLAAIRRAFHAASIEETIRVLLRRHRKGLLEQRSGRIGGRYQLFWGRKTVVKIVADAYPWVDVDGKMRGVVPIFPSMIGGANAN
jgi:hypothetical protein